MRKREEVTYSLAVNFFKDSGVFVADCPTLQLCTHGKTVEHAGRMFRDALSLWMRTVLEMGTLDAALRELGWRKGRAGCIAPKPTTYPPKKVNLIKQDYVNLTLPAAA